MKDRSTAVIADDDPDVKEALLAVFRSCGWKEHRPGPDPAGAPPDCVVISVPRGAPAEQPVDGSVKALARQSRLVIVLVDPEDLLGVKTLADLRPALLLAKSVAPEIVCRLADMKLERARARERATRPANQGEEPMRF